MISDSQVPEEETLVTCGGTLVVDQGSSVAFLNGSAVREGDQFGKFRVVKILASVVVLQRNGCLLAVPRGSRVTVVDGGN
jgi:hypothetical protein